MDDDIRLLAIISCDAGHSYTDIIRSNYYEMSIQSLLSSLVMLIAPVEEVAVAEKVYNGLIITNKVIEKTTVKNNNLIFFMLTFNIINNYKPDNSKN